MPQDFLMGEAEKQLARSLADICGQDLQKLASAKGEELDFDAMLKQASPDAVPGLKKIASLLDLPLKDLVEDPNFREGVNFELERRRDEWVPAAMKVSGISNE
jgi:hypothetical protein